MWVFNPKKKKNSAKGKSTTAPADGPAPIGNPIYQLKVTLDGTEPAIWRRFLVPRKITLDVLHEVLQFVMGWTNSHLHAFRHKKASYGPVDPEFGVDEDMWEDESKVGLDSLLSRPNSKLEYEYDMGDGWCHMITLEKTLSAERGVKYPVCVAGARACPLEDCGGVWGHAENLALLADPKRQDPNDRRELMGDYDPDDFSVDAVNRDIRRNVRQR
jgi:hypothetical protein